MITQDHIDRGRQMRRIIREDVLRGQTFDAACENLAAYLEIDTEAVKLAVAIANEADTKSLEEINALAATEERRAAGEVTYHHHTQFDSCNERCHGADTDCEIHS